VLAYACVYSFYSQDTEYMDVVEQQTENLELHTNALQILLGEPHTNALPTGRSVPLLPLHSAKPSLSLGSKAGGIRA
jgi:p53-associated parkin-like cytoplasmic protein